MELSDLKFTDVELYDLIFDMKSWQRISNAFKISTEITKYNKILIQFKMACSDEENNHNADKHQRNKAKRREYQVWLLQYKDANMERFI